SRSPGPSSDHPFAWDMGARRGLVGRQDRLGIGRLEDRAPDDDVIGAERERFADRESALLIVARVLGPADAGGDDLERGRLSAPSSSGDATTPPTPAFAQIFASESTFASRSVPGSHTPGSSVPSRLVSTVTPSTTGREPIERAA